jgi:hypothetical protein
MNAGWVELVLVRRQPGCTVWCISIACFQPAVEVVCLALWEVPTKPFFSTMIVLGGIMNCFLETAWHCK